MNDLLIKARAFYVTTVFRAMIVGVLIGGVTLVLLTMGTINMFLYDAESIQITFFGIPITPYCCKATLALIAYVAFCPLIRTILNMVCDDKEV